MRGVAAIWNLGSSQTHSWEIPGKLMIFHDISSDVLMKLCCIVLCNRL